MKKRRYRKVSLKPMVPYWHISNIRQKVKMHPPEIINRNVVNLGGYTTQYAHKITGEVAPPHIISKIADHKRKENARFIKLLFGE